MKWLKGWVVFFALFTVIHGHAGQGFHSLEEKDQAQIDEIITFWFGNLLSPVDYPDEKINKWFDKDPAFDEEIRTKYEGLVRKASKGEMEDWNQSPQGQLALVILLDQFPRNIYRGSPVAFKFDNLALETVLTSLKSGSDRQLLPIQRAVLYLPMQHSESKEVQRISIDEYHRLVQDSPMSRRGKYEQFFNYALKHKETIDRFGRFPHRNEVLGRMSSPEEVAFLENPGSLF